MSDNRKVTYDNLKDLTQAIHKDVRDINNRSVVNSNKIENIESVLKGTMVSESVLSGESKVIDLTGNVLPYGILNSVGGKVVKNENKTREVSVKGNSIKWNQLIDKNTLIDTKTINGVTITNNGDGSFTINGTATAPIYQSIRKTSTLPVKVGHKYFIKNNSGLRVLWSLVSGGANYSNSVVITATESTTFHEFRMMSGEVANNVRYTPELIDLTDIYGAGNEITDIATLNKIYGGNLPYNEGELSSVEVGEVKVCGENLFDLTNETPSVGLSSSGGTYSDSDRNTTDYIPVSSGERYTLEYAEWYNFYSQKSTSSFVSQNSNTNVIVPSNAHFIRITYLKSKRNSSIFVKGTTLPTTYTPYNGQSLTLPTRERLNKDDELLVKQEGSELVVSKIERYGEVDLGSLSWVYAGTSIGFVSTIPNSVVNSENTAATIISSIYEVKKTNWNEVYSSYDKIIYQQPSTSNNIVVKDTSYTSVSSIKEHLSGHNLVYKLATPTYTEIARYPISCDFSKVENVLTDNTQIALETTQIDKGVLEYNSVDSVEVVGANLLANSVLSNITYENETFTSNSRAFTFKLNISASHSKLYYYNSNPNRFHLAFYTKDNSLINDYTIGSVDLVDYNIPSNCSYVILSGDLYSTSSLPYSAKIGLYYGNITEFKPLTKTTYLENEVKEIVKHLTKNLWDEEWEVGGLNTTTGATQNNNDRIRSKNFIKVNPNQTYYLSKKGGAYLWLFKYDENNNYLGYDTWNANSTLTIPNNTYFIKFYRREQEGTTYNNDIGIYLTQFANDESILGCGHIDLVNKEFVVDSMKVDLGSLTYDYNSNNNRFDGQTIVNAKVNTINMICSKYSVVSFSTLYSGLDKCIAFDNTLIRIRDSAYTNAILFKQSLKGNYLIYELATPIRISISEFINSEYIGVLQKYGTITFNTTLPYKLTLQYKEG